MSADYADLIESISKAATDARAATQDARQAQKDLRAEVRAMQVAHNQLRRDIETCDYNFDLIIADADAHWNQAKEACDRWLEEIRAWEQRAATTRRGTK